MRQLRLEAYGEDLGQHSWVTSEELLAAAGHLELSSASRLLDLGCGPGGPLTFLSSRVHCYGTGLDVSAGAIAAGRARAAALGVADRVTLREADLDRPLPFASGSVDAAMALDVVLHLGDRGEVFREVARVLVPVGRFLFTDAAVVDRAGLRRGDRQASRATGTRPSCRRG